MAAATEAKLVTEFVDKEKKRKRVSYEGREIYQWQQDLETVELTIHPPPGVKKADLDVSITSSHLKIGIKNTAPYIDLDLCELVVEDDSFWTLCLST